jgi:Tfp pilus assembly protein PilF
MNLRRGLSPLENRRIDSWKEIAAFFGRDERTVKRWERDRALPIHRLPGERGGVFAYTEELTRWLNSTPSAARKRETVGETISIASAKGANPAGEPAAAADTGPAGRPQWGRTRILLPAALAAAVLVWLLPHVRFPHFAHQTATVHRHTPDPEAAELYLKGRYYWNRRTSGSLAQAVDAFTQAVVHDSEYAEAYAGLAECYDLMPLYSQTPDAEAFPRAIAAARKAIALDDSLPEAHAALAFALFYWKWDSQAAFAEFDRAIHLDPRNADAHHWYATSLMTVGRYQDALNEMNQAQQDDPTSASILADQGMVRYTAGDRAGGIAELHDVERDEPDFWAAPRYLATLAFERRDYPTFLAESKRYAELTKDPQAIATSEAAEHGWTRAGERGLLGALLQVEEKSFRAGQASGFDLAHTCVLLGRDGEALAYLKAALQARDFRILDVGVQPWAAPLQKDPEFERLVRQVSSELNHTA